ncbi:MAG: hypothetical protein AAB906_03965, partial [Patescibacteria group bacterium]
SILELVRTHFVPMAIGTKETPNPPAGGRNSGGSAPLTISSFSLAAVNSEFAKRILSKIL